MILLSDAVLIEDILSFHSQRQWQGLTVCSPVETPLKTYKNGKKRCFIKGCWHKWPLLMMVIWKRRATILLGDAVLVEEFLYLQNCHCQRQWQRLVVCSPVETPLKTYKNGKKGCFIKGRLHKRPLLTIVIWRRKEDTNWIRIFERSEAWAQIRSSPCDFCIV